MIEVSEQTKNAYKTTTDKTWTITFPDKNIVLTDEDISSQSIELKDVIEKNSSLSFKGCNASQFRFKAVEITTDLRGEYFTATVQAGNTEVITVFAGYVETQDNLNFADEETEIVGYDRLYYVADTECGPWYDTLTFPMSVRAFRNAFFTYIGITQADEDLPNDSLIMSKKVSDSSFKAKYVMECICQANARYGKLVNNVFKYIKIENSDATRGTYPSDTTFPSDETYPASPTATEVLSNSDYRNVDYSPYNTAKITKVVVVDDAELTQGEYGTNDNNVLSIAGNMVAYSVDLNACAMNIYEEVKEIELTPVVINLNGLPYIECGDIFVCSTRKNLITSYVLNRTLKGVQALEDTYSSQLDQYQDTNEPLSNQIIRLNHATNRLTRSVTETKSELTNYETQTDGTIVQMQSSITQTASAITTKVSKGTVSSEISQEAGQITISSNRIAINSTNFTLSNDGTITARNGNFSGSVTASSGNIGGFTVTQKSIYNGTSSLSVTTAGVYLGTDGIKVSFGNGYGFKATSNGDVEIKTSGSTSLKIGTFAEFDMAGNLNIGGVYGVKLTSSKISIGSNLEASGTNIKIGNVTIDGSTSPYMRVPTTWELSAKSVYGYSQVVNTSSSGAHFGKGMSSVCIGGTGSKLQFFTSLTSGGNTKQTVAKLSSSASLSQAVSKINDLLTALNKYNLISL